MAKDNTKYRWQSTVFCKRRLVLAIVTDYEKQHHGITYEELKKVFPDKLQQRHHGRTKYDVFDTCENVYKKSSQGGNLEKRYFMKDHEIICLQDGTNIAVCGEWNINNITDFIANAEQYGYHIEAVKKS